MGIFSNNQPNWERAPIASIAISQGLKKYKIANDWHLYSEYNDNKSLYNLINDLQPDGNTILLGDIIDLACCKKKDVTRALYEFVQLRKKFGKFYELGNHERAGSDIFPLVLDVSNGKRAMFKHGDLEVDFKKWFAYRRKEHGASALKLLLTKFLDNLDHVKANRPLPNGFLERAAEIAFDHKCDYYVCGHFHVEDQRHYTVNHHGKKIKIIVLPAHKLNEVWL